MMGDSVKCRLSTGRLRHLKQHLKNAKDSFVGVLVVCRLPVDHELLCFNIHRGSAYRTLDRLKRRQNLNPVYSRVDSRVCGTSVPSGPPRAASFPRLSTTKWHYPKSRASFPCFTDSKELLQ